MSSDPTTNKGNRPMKLLRLSAIVAAVALMSSSCVWFRTVALGHKAGSPAEYVVVDVHPHTSTGWGFELHQLTFERVINPASFESALLCLGVVQEGVATTDCETMYLADVGASIDIVTLGDSGIIAEASVRLRVWDGSNIISFDCDALTADPGFDPPPINNSTNACVQVGDLGA